MRSDAWPPHFFFIHTDAQLKRTQESTQHVHGHNLPHRQATCNSVHTNFLSKFLFNFFGLKPHRDVVADGTPHCPQDACGHCGDWARDKCDRCFEKGDSAGVWDGDCPEDEGISFGTVLGASQALSFFLFTAVDC